VASTEHSDEYASAVRVFADGVEIASTLYGIDKLPRIISIMGYKIDVAPGNQSLILEYPDGPGRIGVIGTVLGNSGVNITTMQIGTKPELKRALVYINVEGNMTESLFDSLKDALDYTNIWNVEL
jgi:D-3-phosphoglycerate dehydrogenase